MDADARRPGVAVKVSDGACAPARPPARQAKTTHVSNFAERIDISNRFTASEIMSCIMPQHSRYGSRNVSVPNTACAVKSFAPPLLGSS